MKIIATDQFISVIRWDSGYQSLTVIDNRNSRLNSGGIQFYNNGEMW